LTVLKRGKENGGRVVIILLFLIRKRRRYFSKEEKRLGGRKGREGSSYTEMLFTFTILL